VPLLGCRDRFSGVHPVQSVVIAFSGESAEGRELQEFASMYWPAIVPAGLLLRGMVPWLADVPEPGTSKVIMAPSRARRKPWCTEFASRKVLISGRRRGVFRPSTKCRMLTAVLPSTPSRIYRGNHMLAEDRKLYAMADLVGPKREWFF
jgi:hypothetical protein